MKKNNVRNLGFGIFFMTLMILCGCSRKSQTNSGRLIISLPTLTEEAEANAIQDAVKNLESVDGRPAIVTGERKIASLILTKAKPVSISATQERQLNQDKAEGFYIKSQNGKTVIFGHSDKALANGLFYYLEKLGFRWYLPGEIWTIKPTSLSLKTALNEVVLPDLKMRDFFGSGGFQKNHLIDPEHRRKEAWQLWKDRNRFGGSQRTWGHQWQAFIQRNKKVFDQHPEYLAEVKGKRVKIKNNSKLCVSNEKLQKLFVEDRIKQYEANKKKFGENDPRGNGVGVEPSDGYGHCTCQLCLAMGSVSERVYFLANKTASEISKKYPKAKVGLLAYGPHAAMPTFDLHQNIDLTIIPAGFHSVAPGPIFIKEWSKKTGRPLSLYDYWSIPMWKLDLPGFNFYGVDKKLKFWGQNGINGVKIESTYSKGAIGPALYQLSKIGWDLDRTSETIMKEFISDCFPNCSKPMERIFRRWSDGYDFENDHPFCLSDIKEATSLAKGSLEKERVEEWNKYIHFTGLMSEFKNLKKKSPARVKKANEVFEYMWSVYDTYMIHSTFTQFSITHQHEKNQDLQVRWTLNKKKMNHSIWSNLKSPTKKEMNRLLEKEIKEHPVLYSEKSLKTIKAKRTNEKKVTKRSASKVISPLLNISHSLSIYLKRGQSLSKTLNIKKYKTGKSFVRVMITKGEDPTPAFYKELYPGKSNFTFVAKIEGVYTIRVLLKQSSVGFDFMQEEAICFNTFPSGVNNYVNLYVPIPSGTEEIIYKCSKKVPFISLAGKSINSTPIGENIYSASLKNLKNLNGIQFQEPGKVIKFLNIPNLFFLHPDNLFTRESE